MPTVYVLIGAQGSGKSTWAARNVARLNAVILSSDALRNELEAAGMDASRQSERVFALLEERLAGLIDEGRNVIADATHARKRWREKHMALARARGAYLT